ncbi:MAG: elongation factor P [Phycisphaeraceae bacterium]
MKSQELKPGMAINLDGQVWLVTNISHVKPGKGPAYTQAKLKNLTSGNNVEKRFRSGEDVDQIDLDRREVEYLYSDASGAVFMDCETFDQLTIPDDVLGDALLYIKPNTTIVGLFYNGNPMSVELPAAVDLEVTDTPPGIKNATATNQLKEAVLETGLKTRVPPFISNGQVVRISTETGEYLSKV